MKAADWRGAVGATWADEWRRTDRSFAGLDPALLEAILARAPPAGRVIDIGCGAGSTSLAVAAARPGVELVGLDLSGDLVAVAARRAGQAGRRDLRFVAGDAAATAASLAPVALFVSRHGVMFFDDPGAALAGFAAAAAPGGALVFSCFAEVAANGWASEVGAALAPGAPPPADPHAPGPFAFADPARVAGLLSAAGWTAQAPRRVAFRYVAGHGADPVGDALGFFRRIGPAAGLLRDAAPADRAALEERLRALCERHRDNDTVAFDAAAWLWSATIAGEAP